MDQLQTDYLDKYPKGFKNFLLAGISKYLTRKAKEKMINKIDSDVQSGHKESSKLAG
jgi:hypothetical protein